MKEFKAGGHVVIEGSLLLERPFTVLGYDCHGKLLRTHVPNGTFNMDDGRRTKETFLAAIRFLCHGGMKTNDGGHGHHARGVLRHMVANDAPNLAVRVLGFSILQFALAGGSLEEVR